MLVEADIAGLIRALAEVRGWKISHAARMSSGSGDTVTRLNAGAALTMRRAHAIIQQCSDLWPDTAGDQWPAEFPRPAKKRGAA